MILQRVLDNVDDAIRSGDQRRIADAAYGLESAAMESERARETLARHLVAWLGTAEFRQADGSWQVLSALRHDLELLAPDTQRALVEAMLDAWSHFADWMGPFTISDVLGRVGTEEALDLLERRAGDLSFPVFLPNAYTRFVTSAATSTVRERARAALQALTRHEAEDVRCEALTCLDRLQRREAER